MQNFFKGESNKPFLIGLLKLQKKFDKYYIKFVPRKRCEIWDSLHKIYETLHVPPTKIIETLQKDGEEIEVSLKQRKTNHT